MVGAKHRAGDGSWQESQQSDACIAETKPVESTTIVMNLGPKEQQPDAACEGKKLRVLVVDDQPAVCDVVADTIRYGGHEIVGTAKDGVEAVARAQELRPDLVVMDILMPRMNGVDAMKAILAAKTAKRVLLMSGEYRSLGVTRDEMMREGAAGFMEKPFNVTDLFGLLERWAGDGGAR